MNKDHLHPNGRPYTKEEFVEKIKTDKEFLKRFGNLGKIYGYQWRNWNDNIDQISELIKQLKENPDSRRLLVSAWNISDLPHQVLPPCHYGFQVYTRELSREERVNLYIEKYGDGGMDYEKYKDTIPTRAISLMWSQRSCDFPLGIPYNIASYGLLLTILGKMVNMVPDELIGNLGDTHIYLNQIDGVKEQIGRAMTTEERMDWWFKNCKPNKEVYDSVDEMPDYGKHTIFDLCLPRTPTRTREPYPLPTLKINSGNENWHLLELDEVLNTLDPDITFKVENYQSHPTIKFPLSN
jgi:thymidylate synthase